MSIQIIVQHIIQVSHVQNFFVSRYGKMYRHLELSLEDRSSERILWCNDPNQQTLTYRMTRVPYCVAISSFQAIRSLRYCAKLPDTSESEKGAMERDFHVDDNLTGAKKVGRRENIADRSHWVPKTRTIRSDTRLTQGFPLEYREVGDNFHFMGENHTIKALAIVWGPIKDKLTFTVNHLKLNLTTENFTKRQFLSDIAKIFIPFRWLSPVIYQLRQLMQQV